MVRQTILGSALALGLGFGLVAGCGSDDSAATGSGGAAGSATGGASGAGTGGASGASTGGASGASTGGASGASTGGASGAGTGGAAGAAGGGGVTFINKGTCPSTAPTPNGDCDGAAMCCYEADGPAYVCTASLLLDGGGQAKWKAVPNMTCCPDQEPTVGTSCATPGVIVCCYGSSGYRCGTPQNQNEWGAATGC